MPYYYYPTRYSYNSSGLLLVLICAVFALWAISALCGAAAMMLSSRERFMRNL